MAAPMTLLSQIREYCTVCQLCRGDFKQPEVLPCFHVFCSKCLDSYIKRTVPDNGKALWLLCPTCREIVTIPNSVFSKFPRNEFVQKVAESLNESTEINSNVQGDIPDYTCCFCKLSDTHLYCSDCNKNCCSTCTYQHLYHNVSSQSEKSDKIKCQLSSIQHDVQVNLNLLNEVLKDTRNYETELQSTGRELKRNVTETANELRKIVSEMEDKLINEIDTFVNNENTQISDNLHKCEVGISSEKLVQTIIEFVNNNRDCNGILSFADNLQEIFGQLNQKHATYPKYITKNVLHLHKNPVNIMDNISEIFGKIEKSLTTERETFKQITKDYFISNNIKEVNNKRSYCSGSVFQEVVIAETQLSRPVEIRPVTSEIIVDSFDFCPLKFKENETFSTLTSSCLKSCKISGIACLPNGEIVVVDRNNKCVKFLKGNSVFRKLYGSESLCDVAVLDDEKVAITDKTVHIFNTRGKLIGVFRQKPRDSHGITCSRDNRLLVLDHKTKKLYNLTPKPDMQELYNFTVSELPTSPSYIAMDKTGNVALTSQTTNSVLVFTNNSNTCSAAKLTLSDTIGGLNNPSGLCFDQNGRVFVCDKDNDRIVVIDINNGFSVSCAQLSLQLCHPSAVDFDRDGNLVIAEECGRIRVLSLSTDA